MMAAADAYGNLHRPAGTPRGGEFAHKKNLPPDAALDMDRIAPGVDGTIRCQRWSGPNDDVLSEISSTPMDLAAALDTLPLGDVRKFGEAADNDYLFEVLRTHGVIDHDGPFDIDLDEEQLDRYVTSRERAGQEAPRRQSIVRDPALIEFQLRELEQTAHTLKARRHALVTGFVASTCLTEVPEAKYAVVNPQSYPYLFDANYQRIMIDDETAERLRIRLDGQRVSGSFAL